MDDENVSLRDLLWKLYEENRAQVRHHESQGSVVSCVFVAVAAGVIVLASLDEAASFLDLARAVFLWVLGICGAVFSAKHYERSRLHTERASRYLAQLDSLFPGQPLKRPEDEAENKQKKESPALHRLRLNDFWIWLHVLIAAVGGLMTIAAASSG